MEKKKDKNLPLVIFVLSNLKKNFFFIYLFQRSLKKGTNTNKEIKEIGGWGDAEKFFF